MHILYQETSKDSKKLKAFVIGFSVVLVLLLLFVIGISIYRHTILLGEFFILAFALYVLLRQSTGTYQYVLTDKAFHIKENSMFSHKELVIPYEDMDGIYPFKQQFMGPLRFRYKYRKLSAVDPRQVWALAYAITKGKSVTHVRVLIKANDEFFDVLEQFLPNRVRVTQDQVVYHALIRKDALKHGEDVAAYYEKCLRLLEEAEKEASSKK